jgi:sigma-B regulation protein RsbU (phosphoserine phosphatase)
MFITAYCSVLDPVGHTLTYASAGHNLAFYLPASGAAAAPLTTAGIPLGIVPEARIEQKTLALAPGDVVLFYTDGVTEAMNAADEMFGDERLAAVLAAHRDEPAEAIAVAIEAAVQDFIGDAPQYDDVTLILLKRTALPA